MAPECTLGMGAAEKSAVWHDVTAGERSGLPLAGSHGGRRHLWKPDPPGPASGPEKAPKGTKTERQRDLLTKPQAI